MNTKQLTYPAQLYDITEVGHSIEAGIIVRHLVVKDYYEKRKYQLERRIFLSFTNRLQSYLKKRPDLKFEDKRNIARRLVYLPSGVRAWTKYMPSGFATYSVHKPEQKRLANGKKVDFMTKRLFRHAIDAIGLRSRASVLTWLVQRKAVHGDGKLRWLSIATGSGQPVYDTLHLLPKETKATVMLTDNDKEAIAFARQVAHAEVPDGFEVDFQVLDVFNESGVNDMLDTVRPTVIDAMGLFEYLVDVQASKLLSQLYTRLEPGGMIIFTNMSPDHPQLDLHKRGMGWPGVMPRTVADVAGLLKTCRISVDDTEAYRPSDKVYNIYCVRKEDGL